MFGLYMVIDRDVIMANSVKDVHMWSEKYNVIYSFLGNSPASEM